MGDHTLDHGTTSWSVQFSVNSVLIVPPSVSVFPVCFQCVSSLSLPSFHFFVPWVAWFISFPSQWFLTNNSDLAMVWWVHLSLMSASLTPSRQTFACQCVCTAYNTIVKTRLLTSIFDHSCCHSRFEVWIWTKPRDRAELGSLFTTIIGVVMVFSIWI
jgi:hypothetical protein